VGPDYKPPDIAAPPQFVSQEVLEELKMAQPGDVPAQWWQGFDDTTLNTLVETGLAQNYVIQATMARIDQARAEVRLAGADDNLQIGASGAAGLEDRRALGDGGEDDNSFSLAAGLGAVLPLDVFGRTRRSVEAARAALSFARADLNSAMLGISADIAAEYLGLRGNQRQLELLDESIELQEQTLKIVRVRFETGLAPDLDLQRAIRSVENLRAARAPLIESLQNGRNALATLTGEYPGVYEQQLQPSAPIPAYKSPIPDALPLTVLTRRPDILQAEAVLREAIALIGVAEADYYPSFALAGDLTIGLTGLDGTSATDILIASISALVDQVISDGGARDARRDITEAQAREALANYEGLLRAATEDVERTLAAIKASASAQISLEKVVNASERSFRQAEILYQQGLISFLDVVDAQRSLAEAEQDLARERTNYAVQIASLFEVLGTDIPGTVTQQQTTKSDTL
jgi:NodT family efflux transporter outer membrane factor (OMF) lipoprotein